MHLLGEHDASALAEQERQDGIEGTKKATPHGATGVKLVKTASGEHHRGVCYACDGYSTIRELSICIRRKVTTQENIRTGIVEREIEPSTCK